MLNNGTYTGQYIGKTMCGFTNEHEYCIEINKGIYGYTVEGVTDLTDDEDATVACLNYASEKSLRTMWVISDSEDNLTSLDSIHN